MYSVQFWGGGENRQEREQFPHSWYTTFTTNALRKTSSFHLVFFLSQAYAGQQAIRANALQWQNKTARHFSCITFGFFIGWEWTTVAQTPHQEFCFRAASVSVHFLIFSLWALFVNCWTQHERDIVPYKTSHRLASSIKTCPWQT